MGVASIIGIVNQKGGTGKTTICVNLGVDLAHEGKKILLVDCDPQGSLTISLGHPQPDALSYTLADQMTDVLNEELVKPSGILHHEEGVDLLPANISLAGMEAALVNAMSRETTLKRVLVNYSRDYDQILLDCSPSLGMLTINALAAADRIIIPVQAQYLSIKGVEQLLGTVARVKQHINHRLKIDGVLLTMVDNRTTNSREIAMLLRETYGSKIHIFDAEIPRSVRAAEMSVEGTSIFLHDSGGKVAQAYHALTKEVLQFEQRQKHKSDLNVSLKGADDIFSTEADRQGEKRPVIRKLPLTALVPFLNHPFRVLDDGRMMETVESVREYGVLSPIIVRPVNDGTYEIVSGHRRKRACELAGIEEIPAIIRDLDDDEATIIMVDSVRP